MKRKRKRVGLPRKYPFRLYVNSEQDKALHTQARMCAELWNALLHRREDAYRRTRGQRGVHHSEGPASLGLKALSREISELYRTCPEWRALSTWTGRRVLDHLLKAFDAFFKRVQAGEEEPGYPQFKMTARARSIPHRFASGCKLVPAPGERSDGPQNAGSARKRQKNWRLTLKGVPGAIRARGEFPGAVLAWNDADVIFRDGSWWLVVGVELAPRRSAGTDKITVSLDLIDEFARVERVEGQRMACDESARIQSQSPSHLDNLAGGPSADENAGSDVRAARRERRPRPQPASTDENAGSDVRAVPACRVIGVSRPSADENAGSDVRVPSRRDRDGGLATVTIDYRLRKAASLGERADAIKSERDRRYRKRHGAIKPSWRWLREKKRADKLIAKAKRIRREALHDWSTSIVGAASDLTVISPPIKEATKSPRGNEREWGAAVEPVSDLNRSILNKAPAMAKAALKYKAAEAGIRYDEVVLDEHQTAVGRDLVVVTKQARRARGIARRKAG